MLPSLSLQLDLPRRASSELPALGHEALYGPMVEANVQVLHLWKPITKWEHAMARIVCLALSAGASKAYRR